MEMRLERKVPLEDRMGNHLNPLAESLARNMIAQAFKPYCRSTTRVDFTSFCRVLHKFTRYHHHYHQDHCHYKRHYNY